MICVMKSSLKIIWKTEITFLLRKTFILLKILKYIKYKIYFFILGKIFFLRFLRIQLPLHFFLLWQILKNIDMPQHLPTAEANLEYWRNENFVQAMNIPEILAELWITDDYYYKALCISKDDDLELHLKRKKSSCFVNNYFNVRLKACQANMDIQPVSYEY